MSLKRSPIFTSVFSYCIIIIIILANCSAEENEIFQRRLLGELETLKNFTREVDSRMTEIETKLKSLDEVRISENEDDPTYQIHMKLSQLQQDHEDQLESLRTNHANLTNSLVGLNHDVVHLTRMHNVTAQLKMTSDLILEKRWYEALLHWSFAENHLVHDLELHVNQVLSGYLRQIIRFVYEGHRDDPNRMNYLVPLFTFVYQLSAKEYKVYAYETLIDELLNNQELFDGSEIFVLAYEVKRSMGLNLKARSRLPEISKILTAASTVNLIFLGNSFNGTLEDIKSTHYQLWRPSSFIPSPQTDWMDLHARPDVLKKTKGFVSRSIKYPVYASQNYTPKKFGAWTPKLQNDTGYFLIQNEAHSGFLNVADHDHYYLLNCVLESHIPKSNALFSFYYLDDVTFGIQSASLKKPLVITECQNPDGNGTSFCFTVKDSQNDNKYHWTGARFSTTSVSVAP